MKLTAEEKRLITARRDAAVKQRVELKQARLDVAEFFEDDARVLSAAKQIQAELGRLRSRPRCTCDQQSSDPKCPAARAGFRVGRSMVCDVPPARTVTLRVAL